MNEHIPIRGLEKLNPLERGTIADVIRTSEDRLAGLSTWQRRNIEWQIARDRGVLYVRLAHLENQTVLAQAVIASEGKLEVTRERAHAAIFEATSKLLVRSGEVRDVRQMEAARLSSEGSQRMVAHGIDNLFVNYMEGVAQRARRR